MTSPSHSPAARQIDGATQEQAPFLVRCSKASGETVIYGRYPVRAEADRVAKLLRWAGAVATVEERPS